MVVHMWNGRFSAVRLVCVHLRVVLPVRSPLAPACHLPVCDIKACQYHRLRARTHTHTRTHMLFQVVLNVLVPLCLRPGLVSMQAMAAAGYEEVMLAGFQSALATDESNYITMYFNKAQRDPRFVV